MLASITHELNNPLQTIKNCMFLSQNDLPPDSPVNEFLNMASTETERLSNLVAQLREVYRPRQDGQVKPVQILGLITEVYNLLRTHLRDRHVQWTLSHGNITDPSSLSVNGIADQIKQVFLNIGMNAIEAMPPDGGQLKVDLILSEDGSEVGIKFQDNGPGISPEDLSRLFEPFYTTKTKGLGLGLSICYDIVQRHGGNITAESQPGQGAIFTVWLPLKNPEYPIG
jgi:signal transduction histidine kinase